MQHLQEWKRWQWCLAGAGALLVCWGLSAMVHAWARPTPEQIAQGRELFVHEWKVNDSLSAEGDGLGPVFNASSCVACHFVGGVGGAGPKERNVSAFTVLPPPNSEDPAPESGVIHADAVDDGFQETVSHLRSEHPVIPGLTRTVGGCTYKAPDFDPVRVESINTPPIFGAGLIDRISDSDIKGRYRWNAIAGIGRELQGDFSGLPAGRVRILPNGRVGKFGWKAQFATLEEFVSTACAVEVGLTNPLRAQDVPKENRPNDGAGLDLDRSQFKSLVVFCKTLPQPKQILPEDPVARSRAQEGERLFASIGCTHCHAPDIGDVKGVYSDFLLHRLSSADEGDYEPIPREIPRRMSDPDPNEWKTPPLWGVADTGPWLHDGSAATLEQAIAAHGGTAKEIRENYRNLKKDERRAVIAFLKTLKAPAPAELSGDVVAAADR